MRAQMKAADRSGARVAVIVGDDELADGRVTLRPLRGDFGGTQLGVARGDLLVGVRSMLDRSGVGDGAGSIGEAPVGEDLGGGNQRGETPNDQSEEPQ